MVQDYADAMQSYSLQTFYNTVLATSYDNLNADIDPHELEKFVTPVSVNNIPSDCLFLVAGGDQQKDRLENTLIGVGEKKLYVLDHRSFYDFDCERADSKAYTELINFLKSDFRDTEGKKVPMLWANLDSGNGRATNAIYRNCNRWNKLHAIKGSSSANAPTIPLKATTTAGQELFVLGVNMLKFKAQEILNRNLSDKAYVKIEFSNTLPDDYFDQLTAEELKRVGSGFKWVLKQGQERNEAGDCFNYCLAAIEQVMKGIKQNPWKRLREYKHKKNVDVQPREQNPVELDTAPQESNSEPVQNLRKPKRKITRPRSSWMNF